MPPGQRATIVGANLLVPAGVLFFGWNAAAAAFPMDTELHENWLAQIA
ncbi:MAG TPA: hypothetical protein VFX94_08105 [Burkholderiales bacterium]|nr:hypothetical protein [Burkholderiales bacterium]